MTRNSAKHRCAHAGCRAWAMRGGELCSVHAGRARQLPRPPVEIVAAPAPRPEDRRIPTLEEEIALLAARRDHVDRILRQRLDAETCDAAEALRYLTVLAQVGKSLALMLVQRQTAGGAAEIERFFEAVAERVKELSAATDAEKGN